MLIGVPTEVKNNEYRVAITPLGVHELVRAGHRVMVQSGAGIGSCITDDDYADVGAYIAPTAADVWAQADMILKVKEPTPAEYDLMREGQVLFTYLHLAASEELTRELLARKVTSIAYETVQTDNGVLPLLAPMSEVAGRLSAQIAAHLMLKVGGGRGILMGGVPGTRTANIAILGGGTVGFHAARIASAMGADVTVYDVDFRRMAYIDDVTSGRIHTEYSTELSVARGLKNADAVIGSVLIPGARTPRLVTNEMVADMRPGSVLVDVAIDQGGCFEASRPTTHDDPTFEFEDCLFYCVANMPGTVPYTSTYALTNATMRYVLHIADAGWQQAMHDLPDLARGLSTFDGKLYERGVAEAFGLELATFGN
ncbi:alanine dehydrogenase [Trueperella bialowiezensis]|uniref:Alanine dehydrogenase n=1 Tax=Trueperella bialowiezensis TaxID=312285 RepID=A0A448PEQ2_9ACTO|nr:alanine dehydrogenase [Trueperella bialowiezensis]VEI13422.1 Alanine dehydrogenase [Trueperella bialowiezensis]